MIFLQKKLKRKWHPNRPNGPQPEDEKQEKSKRRNNDQCVQISESVHTDINVQPVFYLRRLSTMKMNILEYCAVFHDLTIELYGILNFWACKIGSFNKLQVSVLRNQCDLLSKNHTNLEIFSVLIRSQHLSNKFSAANTLNNSYHKPPTPFQVKRT